MRHTRRDFLLSTIPAALASQACSPEPAAPPKDEAGAQMLLQDFQPKSMLQVATNPVARAKYPAIDAHAHMAFSSGLRKAANPDAKVDPPPAETIQQVLKWMDELNLQTLVNLTGGAGSELTQSIDVLQNAHSGRFLVCTEPSWEKIKEPDYPKWQADELRRAKEAGARGLKVLKTLGLYLRENITDGPLVKVDDPRFDPMWEEAGALGFPIFIHTSDPGAFFTPTDANNERWEELGNHPDWSFYGSDFPPKAELLAARNRVIERHPRTNFVCLHVANHPEKLAEVGEWFDRYPNMNCEIGARLGELGRQPRTSRQFFETYQDRILFGTDAVPLPEGANYPQQTLVPEMYQCYFRFFETEDEYFDYSPAPTPPQGRWKIYGISLPDEILKKVYHNNAARLLGLDAV